MLSIPCFPTYYNQRKFATTFEVQIPFEERKIISNNIIRNNPEIIPVIVEPYCNNIEASYTKFLVPHDNDIQCIIDEIHEQIKLHDPITKVNVYTIIPDSTNLFSIRSIPSNFKLLHKGFSVKDIYNQYKHDDGFLYIMYTLEVSLLKKIERKLLTLIDN